MNLLLRTLAIGFVIFVFASPGIAGTIYVDWTVPDKGDGTKNLPFKTISQATSLSVSGDVILIRGGDYSENITESDDNVLISVWGEKRPVISPIVTERFTMRLSGFNIRLVGIEFHSGKGISLLGDYCTVRDCVFDRCEQPLEVKGHYNIIIGNEVRDSVKTAPGGLFHVIGAGNYMGNNYFHDNACPKVSAILCQGFEAKIIDNLIYSDKQSQLGFGIATTSTEEKSPFTSCENQEISYNRIYGFVKDTFIRIEGKTQNKTEILHNTLIGSENKAVTGLKITNGAGVINIQFNLIGNMETGLAFDGIHKPNNDFNNLFANKENIKNIGKTAISPGGNDTSIEPKFYSIHPKNPGFLYGFSQVSVDRTKEPGEFRGARPVYVSSTTENMAREKPYLVFPYPLGKTSGSVLTLTDGYLGQRLTLRIGTAGYVLFDLMKVEPIEAVIVYVPKSGIRSLEVSISDDDIVYYPVGKAGNGEVSGDLVVFALRHLKTRGRYILVKLTAAISQPEICEIEVLRGKHGMGSVEFVSSVFRRPEIVPPEYKYKEIDDVPHDIYRLYREEFSKLKGSMMKLKDVCQDVNILKEIQTQLISLGENLSLEGFKDKPEFRTEMWRINGSIARLLFKGRGGYILSESNPYEYLNTLHIPMENTKDAGCVKISACMNEMEHGAFLITNSAEKDIDFTIDVSPPVNENGKEIPLTRITLRHPVEAIRKYGERTGSGAEFLNYIYVSDALVKLDHGQGNHITVPVGQTHQVWLLVNTMNVPAGTYTGKVTLYAEGFESKRIDLVINIHPVEIPNRTSLKTYSWPYTGSERFRHDLAFSVNDMISHKLNTVIEHSFVPWPGPGAFDKDGSLIKPINYGPLDGLRNVFGENLDYFKFYVFNLAFNGYPEKQKLNQDDLEFGSDRWETALREWVNDWAKHMEEVRKISTDKFALYLYDEPVGHQIDEIIGRVGKVLKTADPQKYPYARKVKIYINPMVPTLMTPAELERLKSTAPYLDIICPQFYDYPQEILDELHKLNCELWCYAGITKGRSPYSSSKLISWLAMKQGLKGIGFWGYAYSGTPDYDVIYGFDEKIPGAGNEPLVTSRRWEAWRDGIDDYDLLEKLKLLAEEGAKKGLSESEVKEVRNVFNHALYNVLSNRDNPEVALTEREKMIATIMKLATE